MTNQEAIDTLRLMMNVRVPEETKALSMAIDALEMRTIKKPVESADERIAIKFCPKCSQPIYTVKYGFGAYEDIPYYCYRCGQRINEVKV